MGLLGSIKSATKKLASSKLKNISGDMTQSLTKGLKDSVGDIGNEMGKTLSKSITSGIDKSIGELGEVANKSLTKGVGNIGEVANKSLTKGVGKLGKAAILTPAPTQGMSIDKMAAAASGKVMDATMGSVARLANLKKHAITVKNVILGFREAVATLVIIGVCVGAMIFAYILWTIFRPRLILLSHSEKVPAFMEQMIKDITNAANLHVVLKQKSGDFSGLFERVADDALYNKINELPADKFDQAIKIWFAYYDIPKSFLDKLSYDKKVIELIVLINKHFDDIREKAKAAAQKASALDGVLHACSVTKEQYEKGPLPQTTNGEAANFVNSLKSRGYSFESYQSVLRYLIQYTVNLRMMDMYFNTYYKSLKDILSNRRYGFFNFLIYLIRPACEDLIIDRIGNWWKRSMSSKALNEKWESYNELWGMLGDQLIAMPGKIVERYKDGEVKEEKKKPQVVEHFGFLKGLLSVGEFFGAIMKVALGLATLFIDPIGTITWLIKVIIGLLLTIVLIIVYTILSIPPFNFIFFGLYIFLFIIVMGVVRTLFFTLIFVWIGLASVILWVLDLPGGYISKIMRCENLPSMWYERSNLLYGNKYNRILLCQYPCNNRFTPAFGGMGCMGKGRLDPDFCPQAQVFRIYNGLKPNSPYIMDKYIPDLNFARLKKEGRKAVIVNHFKKKQKFLERCYDANTPYDGLVKTICANCDVVPLENEKDRKKLKHLCKQIYCDGEPREGFCYKFDGITQLDDNKPEPIEASVLFKRIMNMLAIIIISVIITMMIVTGAS
jgi:hypothetical protein